jgi:probable rRNA maturation factor
MPRPLPNPTEDQPEGRADRHEGAIAVEVSDTQGFLAVNPHELAELARRVLREEGIRRASVSIALVDNATIHRINRVHLGHDYPTDVISFVLSEPGEAELAAELVVSVEMARSTAADLGTDAWAELSLYVVHGLLHLCGYEDARDEEARAMRAREGEVLARGGLTQDAPSGGQVRPVREPGETAAWSG